MAPALRPLLNTGLVIALAALIFFVDLVTPRGVALGAAYVCPVLVAFTSPRRSFPVEVAALSSALTVLAYFGSPPYTGAEWVVAANRALSIGMVWFVALLSLERRRVGLALRRAEARSAAVVDAATDAILIVDAAGAVRGINAAGRRIFGLSPAAEPRIADLIPAWTAAGPPAPGVVDAAARRADGTTFPARLAVSQAELEDGPSFVAIVHDASELRARGQALALMLGHLPIEVFRVGPDDAVLERHGDAVTRLGLDPRALLAGLGADLDRARDGQPVHTLTTLEADERPLSFEHWLVLDRVRAPCVLWFCLDVSERRRVERKVEVAAKLAALGELAGNIAHEINNPIGIISAKARLLVTGREVLSDKTRQELVKIASQCDRVAGLTRKLLNYVRPGETIRERVDLRDPARKALALVSAKAQRQGVVVTDALDEAAPTLGSADELEQVFLNLLINALDAMPGGGALRLSGGARHGQAFVTVTDSGVGMDEAVQRRIFEPFFTTKTGDHGTGLGLHICHRIVEGHGGELEVESAPGKGASFTVELPAPTPPNGSGRHAPETRGATAGATS